MEDPGMVDARVGSGKVRQMKNRLLMGARGMRNNSRFDLENVIGIFPGRDASLSWMYTSHGAPAKASAKR